MTDLTFLTQYLDLVVVGICLCVGLVIKHLIPRLSNRIIPMVCALLGLAMAIWMGWDNITPQLVLSGLFSGLAATGLHQVFAQFMGLDPVPDMDNSSAMVSNAMDVVVDEVAAGDLDRNQLQAIAKQMGLQPPDEVSRDDLLQMIKTAAEPT